LFERLCTAQGHFPATNIAAVIVRGRMVQATATECVCLV
jgi:hypothetical protein